jgi:hypothetical protein
MIRLPLPAVFALVVVAAATAVVTLTFKHSTYEIDAANMPVGGTLWIHLNYIPGHITLRGFKNSTFTAEYTVCVFADAYMNATFSSRGVIYAMIPTLHPCFHHLADGDYIRLTVLQMLTKNANSTILVVRTR